MLAILFENENILAVDKPEGIASIPEGDISKGCVLKTLEESRKEKLFVVHRLDKDVSGVLLFARNAETHKFLNKLFDTRQVKKKYIALVHGLAAKDKGKIDKPLRQFGSGRMGIDFQKGKQSVTNFHIINRYNNFTLVNIAPVSGHRHQIRVHFYSIGHPVVGDIRYGEKAMQQKFPRLMLHAQEIAFKLQNDEPIKINSPVPRSFVNSFSEICCADFPLYCERD
ncbi:MAG: RluA family pseudouridine synthase [Bacteroidia bacterium]|nr:RluA family pseudouridine synthase [Bacteroidia bacterium]